MPAQRRTLVADSRRGRGTGVHDNAIQVEGLVKTFGPTRALAGIDLAAPRGRVLGLLGPNGSGKTTTVRVLATLLRPDAGTARVLGHDVVAEAAAVRARIGLTGQYAAVDEALTGLDNVALVARLLDMPRREARRRSVELVEQFGLAEAGGRAVRTYSGGMRRRLDLAVSLVGRPEVLFLDEPTSGLDPRHRGEVWDRVRALVADGVSVLLTTQQLEEADQLADDLVVLDRGRVVATGTPAWLKSEIGGRRLHVRPLDRADVPAAEAVVAGLVPGVVPAVAATGEITVPAPDPALLHRAGAALDAAGLTVAELCLRLRLPSLDDEFLTLTGRPADDDPAAPAGNPAEDAA